MTKCETEDRLSEALAAMSRLRTTFNQGDNRYGQYGRNVQAAFDSWAKVVEELTGKRHHIYGDQP